MTPTPCYHEILISTCYSESCPVCLCCQYNNTLFSVLKVIPFFRMTQTLRGIVCGNQFIRSPSLLHSLGGNGIHGDGASALANGLCQNTTLEELK